MEKRCITPGVSCGVRYPTLIPGNGWEDVLVYITPCGLKRLVRIAILTAHRSFTAHSEAVRNFSCAMKGGYVSNVLRKPGTSTSTAAPRKPVSPSRGTGAAKCHRDRSVETAGISLMFIGISGLLIGFMDQGRIKRYRESL